MRLQVLHIRLMGRKGSASYDKAVELVLSGKYTAKEACGLDKDLAAQGRNAASR